jgi:hypothetical protein
LTIATAATGVARTAHYVIPTGQTQPIQTLLLEPQRTNLCIRSEEFDTWTNVNVTVTANSAVAPDGTATADLLTSTVSASARRVQALTFTGDGEKCASVFLKAGTSARTSLVLFQVSSSISRHDVSVNWSGGVPTIATNAGGGTLYPIVALGNGWYRIQFSATGIVAAETNQLHIYPDRIAGTGTVLAWGAQAENAVVPSSYIPTAALTVTRNADSLFWDIPALVPREMTVYVRYVNLSAVAGAGQLNGLVIGAPSIAGAHLYLASFNNTGITSGYSDGTTNRFATATTSPALATLDVVEARTVARSDFRVTSAASVNAGSEVEATSALATGPFTAFAQARLYIPTTSSPPMLAITHVAIALGTQTRATMRAIAGVP